MLVVVFDLAVASRGGKLRLAGDRDSHAAVGFVYVEYRSDRLARQTATRIERVVERVGDAPA
jgi:hypothetical protein